MQPVALHVMFWAAASTALIGVWASWLWRRDVLFPPFVASVVWATVLTMYLLLYQRFAQVSPEVWTVVAVGVSAFVIGGVGVTWLFRTPPPAQRVYRHPEANWALTRIAITAAAVGLPLFALAAYRIAIEGPTSNLAVNLRLAYLNADSGTLSLYAYIAPICFVATAVAIAAGAETRGRTFWVAVGCAVSLGYALLATGRTAVLFFLCVVLGVAAIRGTLSARVVATYFVGAIALLWIVVAFSLGKGVSEGSEALSDIGADLLENFYSYLLSGLPALSIRIEQQQVLELGAHTFRTLLAVGKAIGLDVVPPVLVRDFVSVPMATNVYTVYEPYFRDFSFGGVIVSQLFIGAFHTVAYEKALVGSVRWQVIYAALLFPTCTQFFQDSYASLLSLWIQVSGVVVVLTLPSVLVRVVASAADDRWPVERSAPG